MRITAATIFAAAMLVLSACARVPIVDVSRERFVTAYNAPRSWTMGAKYRGAHGGYQYLTFFCLTTGDWPYAQLTFRAKKSLFQPDDLSAPQSAKLPCDPENPWSDDKAVADAWLAAGVRIEYTYIEWLGSDAAGSESGGFLGVSSTQLDVDALTARSAAEVHWQRRDMTK